jgi:hypothetical protein
LISNNTENLTDNYEGNFTHNNEKVYDNNSDLDIEEGEQIEKEKEIENNEIDAEEEEEKEKDEEEEEEKEDIIDEEKTEINIYEIDIKKSCDYYYYLNSTNNYECTTNKNCPNLYSKLILKKNECINSCQKDDIYKYEFNNKCYEKCPSGTNNNNYICEGIIECDDNSPYLSTFSNECMKSCSTIDFLNHLCSINNDNIYIKQNFILNIIKDLKDPSLNELLNNVTNEYKEDIIINEKNILYQITSSYNQKNKEYKNISTIDLGECENILKDKYKINKNDTLIIFKSDYFLEGLSIPVIKYQIFNPYTKEQLDINYCKNTTIKINIPVSINEDELYKHDPSSDFYNDKCFPYTSKNSTDMTLYDRKNEYNKKNMSLCSKGCKYEGYNSEIKKVICDCEIQNEFSLSLYLESIINNEELLDNFIDIKKTANLDIIKCYKTLFSKDGLIKNIGSYILFFFIFIFMIFSLIFCCKEYNSLKKKITEIVKIKKKKQPKKINKKKK